MSSRTRAVINAGGAAAAVGGVAITSTSSNADAAGVGVSTDGWVQLRDKQPMIDASEIEDASKIIFYPSPSSSVGPEHSLDSVDSSFVDFDQMIRLGTEMAKDSQFQDSTLETLERMGLKHKVKELEESNTVNRQILDLQESVRSLRADLNDAKEELSDQMTLNNQLAHQNFQLQEKNAELEDKLRDSAPTEPDIGHPRAAEDQTSARPSPPAPPTVTDHPIRRSVAGAAATVARDLGTQHPGDDQSTGDDNQRARSESSIKDMLLKGAIGIATSIIVYCMVHRLERGNSRASRDLFRTAGATTALLAASLS